MSGGSYNYICYDHAFMQMYMLGDVEDMAERLEGLGYADDAAKATRDLIKLFHDSQNQLLEAHAKLSGVWHAVEWWDSADRTEDGVKEALREYRSAQPV